MCRVEDAGVMSSTSSSNSTTSSTHYSSASSSSSSSSSTMSRTTSTTTGTTLCYSESNTICNNTSSSSADIQQHGRNADDEREQQQQQQQIRPLLLEAHQHSMASCKLPLQHDLSSQSSHSFNTHCLLFEKEEQDNMVKDNDDVNPCSTITPASQMLLLQEQNSMLHHYGDDHNNTSILLSRSRADEEELDALLQRNCSREVSSDSKESTTLEGRSALMSDNGQHQHPHQQQRIVLFGVDISHCHERVQFFICAGGVFVFTIAYGYLQELISVHLFSRQYTIFLSTCQFAGYAFWSFVLMNLDKISLGGYPDMIYNSVSQDDWSASEKKEPKLWSFYDVWRERYMTSSSIAACASGSVMCCPMLSGVRRNQNENESYEKYEHVHDKEKGLASANSPLAIVSKDKPSWIIYVMLSIVRAIDVGMTNGAMRFINYPMKTLVKSSRVAFTMMCGIMIGKKRYSRHEYLMVSMLVIGLFIFIHADMSTKDTVFHPIGLSMLAISLLCDGTFANYSEQIMTKHNITQDEFQFYIYSISFLAMLPVVILNQDFHTAFSYYFLRDGSISDIQKNISRSLVQETSMDKDSSISSAIPTEVYFWNAGRKALVMIFFTLTGLCGSSCNGAITKKFGALSMSITSTSRKACTLFVSFVSFSSNKCTPEHLAGMAIFISALMLKSPSARSSRPNHYRNN